MKKSIFKTVSFWIIFISFIVSLFIIFASAYLFDSFKDLNFRLLVAFCIFLVVLSLFY